MKLNTTFLSRRLKCVLSATDLKLMNLRYNVTAELFKSTVPEVVMYSSFKM